MTTQVRYYRTVYSERQVSWDKYHYAACLRTKIAHAPHNYLPCTSDTKSTIPDPAVRAAWLLRVAEAVIDDLWFLSNTEVSNAQRGLESYIKAEG